MSFVKPGLRSCEFDQRPPRLGIIFSPATYAHHRNRYPSIILIANTPVGDGVTRAWHALLIKSPHQIASQVGILLRTMRRMPKSSLPGMSHNPRFSTAIRWVAWWPWQRQRFYVRC